jgi:hypothetical protein
LLVSVLCACGHAPACPLGSEQSLRSELFLGLVRRDGAEVSDQAFADFVDQVVSPLLPGGFTLLATQGQYRDTHGALVREPGHLLLVLHQREPAIERAVEQVRNAYKKAFDQESVLRTDAPSCASF